MLYYLMPTFLMYILILFPIFLILAILSSLLSRNRLNKNLKGYRYTRKTYLMTKGENEFFQILFKIIDNKYHIFPQIHLISLLEHKIAGQSWKGAKSHIDRLSVDYVICDRRYLSPILAIELDDISHKRGDRIERDLRVERILAEARIPLLRVKYKDRLNEEIIRESLSQFLKRE